MRKILAVLSVCVLVQCSLAQEANFDLSKRPTLRPGDVVASSSTRNDTRVSTVGGKTLFTITFAKQSATREEVLAVGRSGVPAELRIIITQESTEENVSGAIASVEKKTILRDVVFLVKKDGNQYVCETDSILAKDANAPRASQVALLKDVVKPASEWDGYPEREIN